MSEVFFGLGTNQGDRLANLSQAVSELRKLGVLNKLSSVYETEPKYELNQPKFLNMICSIKTDLNLEQIHKTTLQIETILGRVSTYKNGPRVIDIDILFSDSLQHKSDNLTVPHPKISERAFVLVPFKEVAANLKIFNQQSVSDLLNELSAQEISEVQIFAACPVLNQNKIICLNDRVLDFQSKPLVMGIINITPDSFSGDGTLVNSSAADFALRQAQSMLSAGADILDIGGESSRPGSIKISAQQEADRVIPVIEKIVSEFNPIISIDTYKSSVATQALFAGAKIVNDIYALKADPQMAGIIKDHNAAVVLMHNSSDSQQIETDTVAGNSYKSKLNQHTDTCQQVLNDLLVSIKIARQAGIADCQIILDPGFGFGKSVEQNLSMLRNFSYFKNAGFALLSATSRKSFIGQVLKLGVEDRLEGGLAAAAISVMNGANIIRTHDVTQTRRVLDFVTAVKGS